MNFNSLGNFIKDHDRNIPVKFGENWSKGLGGDVIEVKSYISIEKLLTPGSGRILTPRT